MFLLSIILGLIVGISVAALFTMHTLSKSNEIGNSKSTISELGGSVFITDKQNNVMPNYKL